MKTGQIIGLFGEGMAGKSRVVTVQRRLNCYFETRKDADKSRIVVYGTPGLTAAFQLSTPLSSPVRGFVGNEQNLYACSYNQFLQLDTDGSTVGSGTLNTFTGRCEISANEAASQVLVVDGNAGYLWNGSALSTIGGAFPNGAKTLTFASGFFVAESTGTQQFFCSEANDGSTWDDLAFASANAYPDLLLAVDNLDGNLILFSEQHIEFWQNVGTSPMPFAPILSAVSEYGIAAVGSRAHLNDSIIFLAQNQEGQVQVCRIQGFTVRPISTPDVDYILNDMDTVDDAVGLIYGVGSHKFYQLTFPTENRTLVFDALTELWGESQTGVSQKPTRHQALLSAYCDGTMYLSDYASNQIYTMSSTAYSDNGTPILRELVTRHVLSNFDWIRPSVLYLDMETGVGLQSGQGSNPQIMLQYSKDNGATWSAERWASLGAAGQYRQRVIWRRFGCTRDATWKIRMTDPVPFVLTTAALKLRVRK